MSKYDINNINNIITNLNYNDENLKNRSCYYNSRFFLYLIIYYPAEDKFVIDVNTENNYIYLPSVELMPYNIHTNVEYNLYDTYINLIEHSIGKFNDKNMLAYYIPDTKPGDTPEHFVLLKMPENVVFKPFTFKNKYNMEGSLRSGLGNCHAITRNELSNIKLADDKSYKYINTIDATYKIDLDKNVVEILRYLIN